MRKQSNPSNKIGDKTRNWFYWNKNKSCKNYVAIKTCIIDAIQLCKIGFWLVFSVFVSLIFLDRFLTYVSSGVKRFSTNYFILLCNLKYYTTVPVLVKNEYKLSDYVWLFIWISLKYLLFLFVRSQFIQSNQTVIVVNWDVVWLRMGL